MRWPHLCHLIGLYGSRQSNLYTSLLLASPVTRSLFPGASPLQDPQFPEYRRSLLRVASCSFLPSSTLKRQNLDSRFELSSKTIYFPSSDHAGIPTLPSTVASRRH